MTSSIQFSLQNIFTPGGDAHHRPTPKIRQTLLWLSSGDRAWLGGGEELEELAANVALEDADDLALGGSFSGATGEVVTPCYSRLRGWPSGDTSAGSGAGFCTRACRGWPEA